MRKLISSSAVVLSLWAAGPLALAAPPEESSEALVKTLEAHVAQRTRARAEALIAKNPRAHRWDRQRAVNVRCTFRSRAEGLTIEVERRPGVSGPLVVAFLPGVVGLPLSQSDDGPTPQDLLLLRAPILQLRAGARRTQVQVPVACASFRRHGPNPGHVYSLTRAPRDSVLDALAQVLCAARTLPPTPELALAIWAGHEGLSAEHLGRSHFRTFPTPRERVLPSHGPGAERLLRDAGLRPETFPFFRGEPRTTAPAKPEPRKPARPVPPGNDLS